MNSKKGFVQVIVLILLLLVSVVGIMASIQWQDQIETTLLLSSQAKSLNHDLTIKQINSTHITIDNNYAPNLEVDRISVDDQDCYIIQETLDKTKESYNLTDCSLDIYSNEFKNVFIMTNYGMKESRELIR